MVVTANAGANTSQATTAAYVTGSTQLLDYSTTPGGETVIRNLSDGILSGGVNIGTVGPLTTDTEEVQFQAKVNCPVVPTSTPPVVTPTKLPSTGAETSLAGMLGTGAIGYAVSAYRRSKRSLVDAVRGNHTK
jgi:hypothetical protein